MPISGTDLIVNRANLSEAELVPATAPDTPEAGTCLLRINRFSLTANNITYAVAAEQLGYWNFFPHPRDGYGRIPVWGFADVVASAVPEVPVGTHVYGYLPMSTHLTIRPGEITPHTMMDLEAHRQPMSPIYNQYTFTKADPAYREDHEGLISLFRPLFTTSFLLDDFHRENAFFGASTILLSSASSKTAIGLAFLLARDKPQGVRIVGLTSPSNREFVAGLGLYDEVIGYDDIATLPRDPAAFVDMAGNQDVLRAVHGHFGDDLKNSCRVGMTHWQETELRMQGLPGPKPEFFFAPSYAQERLEVWGGAGFQARLGEAWGAFLASAEGWVKITEAHGADAVMAAYQDMLAGRIDPAEGHILSL